MRKRKKKYPIAHLYRTILIWLFIVGVCFQCKDTESKSPIYHFDDFIELKKNSEQKKILTQIKDHQYNNMYETQKWLDIYKKKFVLKKEDSIFSDIIDFKNTFFMGNFDRDSVFPVYYSLREKVKKHNPLNYFLLLELDGVMIEYYHANFESDSLFSCIERSFEYLGNKEYEIVKQTISVLYLNTDNNDIVYDHNHDWESKILNNQIPSEDTIHYKYYYSKLKKEKYFHEFSENQDTILLRNTIHQIIKTDSIQGMTINKVNALRYLCYYVHYSDAIPMINTSIAIAEAMGYQNILPTILLTKGHLHMQEFNYQKAFDAYKASLETFYPFDDSQHNTFYWFAYGHLSSEYYPKAIQELQKIADQAIKKNDYFLNYFVLHRMLWLHDFHKNAVAKNHTTSIIEDYDKNVYFKKNQQDLKIENLNKQISLLQLHHNIDVLSKEKERDSLQVKNQRYFLIILSMFLLGAVVIIIVFFQRMKILKQLQIATAKLEHKNEHMKVLLQELSNQKNQLVEANAIIEKSLNERNLALNRLQDATAVLSHDFKNPLNAIYQFTELSKLNLENNKIDEIKEYLHHISESSLRLNKMVEWLYSHSFQTLQIRKEMTDVDLNKTLQQITLDLKMMLDEKDAIIQLSLLPIIRGHDILVHQIFQNLISNSLKYSDPNRKPFIKIWSETLEDYQAIYIQDNGIGIPEDHINKVFEKHYQVDKHQDEKKGMGLGLNTCREIIEMLSGKIEIESTVGEGTTIIIYFPSFYPEKTT